MDANDGGSARRRAIRDDLTDAQRRLDAALDRVREEHWARQTPNEGWAVRDLLAHLATAEAGFIRTLSRMAAGEGGLPADFDVNRWNAGQLRRQEQAMPAQLRATLTQAHQEMLALLVGLEDAALDQRGRMSVGGEGSVEDTFRLVARHKRLHTQDLEAALA